MWFQLVTGRLKLRLLAVHMLISPRLNFVRQYVKLLFVNFSYYSMVEDHGNADFATKWLTFLLG
jgi:hypothetical protein